MSPQIRALAGPAQGRLPLRDGVRWTLRIVAGLGVLALAVHIAHGQFGLGGHSVDNLVENDLYDAIVTVAALSCLARAALVKRERWAWFLFGVGMSVNAAGEIYYSLAFGLSANPPIPSLADLLYLLYYPFSYAGLLLLLRTRVTGVSKGAWLDGAIAAATSAAVIASVAFESILESASHGSAAALATTLAYPVGDMVLLGTVAAAFAFSGWRSSRSWYLLAAGLAVWAIADTGYTYTNANLTYVTGGVLDSLWLVAAVLMGCAAWQPGRGQASARSGSTRLLSFPAVCALASLGTLVYGGFHHVGAVGLVLAAVALVLVIARAGLAFTENARLLETSRREAVTDALTGLGNRRQMQSVLERALAEGRDSPPAVFAMFDLDGFKGYNDRFCHLAGDTLLAHLGTRLRDAIGSAGTAYRPGGDEFCVLLDRDLAQRDMRIAAAVIALSAEGDGFSVTASHGCVTIPSEASTPTQALRLADDRMYARKGVRRGSAGQQMHDVLLGLLRERQPDLHDHLRHVGHLAVMIGRRLGMSVEELDELRRAAELHDIGKAAIPDSILNKPGPLDEEEWTFMRRHTLIGERILAAAPALAPVAELVRSSHERWDGSGYPDCLAGEAIPLGSRVIFVCDAFDAMTSDRPYARARTPEEATSELRQGAGTQFDPTVVRVFESLWPEIQAGEPVRPAERPVAFVQAN
jgi:two-component system, cell cycle response regulator